MGAEFRTLNCDTDNTSTVEQMFKAAQEQDRCENGHSYSGGLRMASGIRFKNETVFEDYNSANEYLLNYAEKWGPSIAVLYKNKKGKSIYLVGAWCSS